MKFMLMNPYKSRSLAAYFRSEGGEAGQPKEPDLVLDEEGKHYVVLRNIHGILAVYRVRNDDMLKRLKRWPPAITRMYE